MSDKKQKIEDANLTQNIIKTDKSDYKEYVITFIFIAFVFGMCILFFVLPKLPYSKNEKRYLADAPSFSLTTLFDGSFTDDTENYITDHIPFRDFYVGVNSYYDLASGRNGLKGVYFGSDGYLINDPVEKDNNIEKNVKIFAEFIKKNNFNATLMVVPSTGYIEESKLPLLHKKYRDDKYFGIIEENKGNMDFIDLRGLMKQASSEGHQLYYKTDHHWTSYAAFLAYNELFTRKHMSYNQGIQYSRETYGDFYGTTYSTGAFWLTPSDDIDLWYSNGWKDINVSITEGNETKEYNTIFFKEHLNEDDKYPVFLDGNHALTKVKNGNAPANTRLLVIKDSFSHCFVPFLADNYSEILMVDLRYYKKPVSELAKNEHFGDVLILYGLDNLATDTDIAFLE